MDQNRSPVHVGKVYRHKYFVDNIEVYTIIIQKMVADILSIPPGLGILHKASIQVINGPTG
jgi:hypothetical protein